MIYHYGILSTASITPRFIQAVQAYGDKVSAIASRSLAKAQEMAESFNIANSYGSYEELCQDATVDIVYIATPNHLHVEAAMLALRNHKHVIVEKPFCIHKEDALSLFQFAQRQGCFLMEAQKSVFLPATIRLKEIIDTQHFLNLRHISMLASFPDQYPNKHWMRSSNGGVLYGSASYTFEYLMYLLENPSLTCNSMMVLGEEGAIEDASLQILLNEDILADSHITMRVQTQNQAIFYFENGYVEIPNYWKARKLMLHPKDKTPQIEEFPVAFEMKYEVAHIHECIEQGLLHSPIMTPERTILCVQMVESLVKEQAKAKKNLAE